MSKVDEATGAIRIAVQGLEWVGFEEQCVLPGTKVDDN